MSAHRTVSLSRTIQTYLLMPVHMNAAGCLYGGQLMSWIDMMAGIVAMRHCDSKVVTVAVDNLTFKSSAYNGDVITLDGRITWVGSTSMEVRVDTFRENKGGEKQLINTAFLVMVCLDGDGRPQRAPALLIENIEEQQEWEAACRRAELRKARRAEISDGFVSQRKRHFPD